MPALGVCHGQPAKERGQITIGTWPHHQVPVIGHHTIGEESHPHPLTRFRQHSLERLIITILGKELHSGISTVQDVIHQPTQGYAARSRHAITLPTAKWRGKKKTPYPPFLPPTAPRPHPPNRPRARLLFFFFHPSPSPPP